MNNGEIVELVIRRNHISISELARRLHVSRRTVYNWFTQRNLSLDNICEIGKVLDYDFSADFPDKFNGRRNHATRQIQANLDENEDSANYWRNKYINLLERYSGIKSYDSQSLPEYSSQDV